MKFKYSEDEVTEMDTVKGVRESGKRLLTMIFRKNNVMLLFLMPDGKAESVKRVLDYLETGLGIDVFRRLFPVILTDNGSEFKKVDELELTLDEDGFLQKSYYDFVTQVDKLKVEVQSIFLNCDSRSIFRYAQSIKGCKIEKYERRCSFDTKRECHRGNEKKWWICYLSAIKSDC